MAALLLSSPGALASYPAPSETITCLLGPWGARCSAPAPVAMVERSATGPVFAVETAEWPVVHITGIAYAPTGYSLHVANARSSNGWGGDNGTSRFDAELYLHGATTYLYANDLKPATRLDSVRHEGPATPFDLTICHGAVTFETPAHVIEATGASVFQLDGRQPDEEAREPNDTTIWIGLGRTVGDPTRTGTGVPVVRLTLSRP